MSNENALSNQYEEMLESSIDIDDLEEKLQGQLDEKLEELDFLEKEKEKIGNPESLGETIQNVVWEQFCNQIGVAAGEDFIKNNNGLNLDLSEDAHIQTAENFKKGILATHNYTSRDQLEKNYDRYENTPHKEFRKKYVDPEMDNTLERAGTLHKQGVETVKDIYTGRQIPTETKLDTGKNNPEAAQREHVKPSAEIYKDPSLQMANSDEELAAIINDPENLQGYTTAERNNRKSDKSADEMDNKDKNKHWEKANERAEKHLDNKRKEGEDHLRTEGEKTRKAEALKIGGEALKAVLMQMLASLVKTIIGKLVIWFKQAERKISTFIDSVKEAVCEFVRNMKKHLITAADTMLTTIATAIIGPIVSVIKKAWILFKQGWQSLKEAIAYIKDPENRKKPIGILIAEVGKIVITGLSVAGAIVLGEVISKSLLSFPAFAIEIPLLGSLASIIGIFMGAVVAGIIGAIAINKIDKYVANRLKAENELVNIKKGNEVLSVQEQLKTAADTKLTEKKAEAVSSIKDWHAKASGYAEEVSKKVFDDNGHKERSEKKSAEINELLNQL